MTIELWNTALWIVQGVLAVVFLLTGIMKLTRSKDQLAQQMDWVADFSLGSIRGIGFVEVAGAVGLIVPGLLGVVPWLTRYAALGLGLLMVGAVVTHLRRREWLMAAVTFVLGLLCLFVWYGRAFQSPLA